MKNKRILIIVICLVTIALVASGIIILNNNKPNGGLSEINLPGQTVSGNNEPTATATSLPSDTPTETATLATPNTEPVDTPNETSLPSETPTSTPIDNQQENPKLYSYEETTQKIQELRTTLMETEKQGFEAALSSLNNEYSYYNHAIARWNLFKAYNYYYDELGQYKAFLKEKYPTAMDYLFQKQPNFSPLYFGASSDHVYFLCISQPLRDIDQEYKDTLTKLRGKDDEFEFLLGLASLTEGQGYYAVDLYVEDGLEMNRILTYSGIKLYGKDEGIGIDDREHTNSIHEPINDVELDSYLKKHNREINYSNELRENSWNLILLPLQEDEPVYMRLFIDWFGSQGLMLGP